MNITQKTAIVLTLQRGASDKAYLSIENRVTNELKSAIYPNFNLALTQLAGFDILTGATPGIPTNNQPISIPAGETITEVFQLFTTSDYDLGASTATTGGIAVLSNGEMMFCKPADVVPFISEYFAW